MAKEQRTLGFHLDCSLTTRVFHRNQKLRADPISFTSFCRMNKFSFYECEGWVCFFQVFPKVLEWNVGGFFGKETDNILRCTHMCPNTQSWESSWILLQRMRSCKCSQLRPYLELGRCADIVRQCKGPICSTELPPAVQRLRGSAGQCRPLQWCLGVGDDITLGA